MFSQYALKLLSGLVGVNPLLAEAVDRAELPARLLQFTQVSPPALAVFWSFSSDSWCVLVQPGHALCSLHTLRVLAAVVVCPRVSRPALYAAGAPSFLHVESLAHEVLLCLVGWLACARRRGWQAERSAVARG